jgi:hypothetical protein
VVTGRVSRNDYIKMNSFRPGLRTAPLWLRINEELPLDARLFIIGSNTLYYLDREYFADSVPNVSITRRIIAKSQTAQGFHEWLLQEEFSHVVSTQPGRWDWPEYLPEETLAEFRNAREIYQNFKAEYAELIYQDENSQILKIQGPGY